ncbi:MAG: TetR/AcrR family transcriptional regulator [Nostoc sp.]|uniref:TetR/AcrR family transcriptional regulator n=1 Tax=Nostoc sp. TaxID=1180 RepID=UPI002FF120FB
MTQAPNPKRRNELSHQAILNATIALLEEEGYAHMSIEAIARRAGVSKKTIYRWWTSKAEVVMEAYAAYSAREILIPDTGAVQTDLERLFAQLFTVLTTTPAGTAMAGIMSEAQSDPQLAQNFFNNFIANRQAIVLEILERGVERGELRSDCDLQCVIDTLYGAMWYRLMLKHRPLTAAFAKTLIQQAIAGIE